METENPLPAKSYVEVQAQYRDDEYLGATILSFKIGMGVASDFIERMKRLPLEERRAHPHVRLLEHKLLQALHQILWEDELRALHQILWEEENREGGLDDS